MLLDSFVHQAVCLALQKLDLRRCLGRAYERSHGVDASDNGTLDDLDDVYGELAALQPRIESTFRIVDMLRTRTRACEPSESIRIRSRILDFLRNCYSDVLTSSSAPKRAARSSNVRDACAAIRSPTVARHDPALSSASDHYVWSLIRPAGAPRVVVEMFLLLSAQISQAQTESRDQSDPLMVGKRWYSLLSDLLGQLGLSAYQFGDCSQKQLLSAFSYVSPTAANRKVLYPSLWRTVNSRDIAAFDSDWTSLHLLVASLEGSQAELLARCSPHYFSNSLSLYLRAVIDVLDPPTLDLYDGIRQTGNIPPGFFAAPDFVESLPPCPALVASTGGLDEEQSSGAMTGPSSAYALGTATSSVAPMLTDTPLAQDARPRLALPSAYTPSNGRQAPLMDDDVSVPSDVEMSPSQHAYVKRQRSNESGANFTPSRAVTLHEQGSRLGTSMLDDENMDIEGTVVVHSPSAMLSARHDKRVRDSMRHMKAPPALDFASASLTGNCAIDNGTADEGANADSSEMLPLDDSVMTTPKSQTGENAKIEKHKYVSDRVQGDIEGGGRPHRRRHDVGAWGTPGSTRNATRLPPPQTMLSPRNIAVAQLAMATPERGKGESDTLLPPQVTPEHQIGPAADAGARSASRYVVCKEEGDTEGGGRKHRKRFRSGLELAHTGL
ncbi:hypothetical protein GGI20_000548 [Coemansia sp. BCRC 34301]|nr:hypothetical protein GGI20_000548 [Coemansia sp. BCRC 34301]